MFDFSDIITKIHPPFQNPGSALVIPFQSLTKPLLLKFVLSQLLLWAPKAIP